MATLRNLTALGDELSETQLDDVDGGIIPMLIAFNIAIWSLNGIVWLTSP